MFPQERYDQCQGALSAVAAYFAENEAAIRQQSSLGALGWARIHLQSEQAWQKEIHYFFTDFLTSCGAREVAMPGLVQAIRDLRFPHAKVALWSHNAHIATNGINLLFDEEPGGTASMGDYLRTALGHKYVTIGATGYNLAANWPAANFCGVFQLLGPNALESVLHNVGQDFLLLDLTPRCNGQSTFLAPNITYSVRESRQVIPSDTFDALVFMEDSPAMHALGFAPCP
jgi:erythromycin esterase-like protein